MSHPAPHPGTPTPPPGPSRPARPMTGKFRDAFVLALAQNVILAGLIILTAGVPTW